MEPFDTTSNVYAVGPLKFEALGDRIIILEDKFRSGYECPTCNGNRHGIRCDRCGGTGTYSLGGPELKCGECNEGWKVCPECGGKGGLLVVPEETQRRPTTGIVVSVGEGHYDTDGNLIPCRVKVGDAIMYSNFSGFAVDLYKGTPEEVTLRLLHDNEVLCRMEGHLDLKMLRGKSEVATFKS